MIYAITMNGKTTKHSDNTLSNTERFVINEMLSNAKDGQIAKIHTWERDLTGERGLLSVITKDSKALHHTHNGYRFNV